MSFSIGIVGLPNVGKSTLFKALTKKQVDCANYPFCTIDPNVGVVKVPDERLDKLTDLSKSEKTIATSIEFVDIAGLVKGASKGEGLGNKFLANIREVDAIAHVVRIFEDKNIVHVSGKPDPKSDIETINLELIFADLATVDKRLGGLQSQMKAGLDKSAKSTIEILEKIKIALDKGEMAATVELSDEEKKLIKELALLTLKPMIYVLNHAESGVEQIYLDEAKKVIGNSEYVTLCAKIESEMAELSPDEIKELGLSSTGLDDLIISAYKALDLITYFTTGLDETRAWTIKVGTKAPQAAGVIHTDFERGFIRAEVIKWQDLINVGGEVAAKEKGLIRLEGKEYIFQDGDVAVFRFAN